MDFYDVNKNKVEVGQKIRILNGLMDLHIGGVYVVQQQDSSDDIFVIDEVGEENALPFDFPESFEIVADEEKNDDWKIYKGEAIPENASVNVILLDESYEYAMNHFATPRKAHDINWNEVFAYKFSKKREEVKHNNELGVVLRVTYEDGKIVDVSLFSNSN